MPAPAPLPWLLALRALEGLGFLLAVMPGPGLIRSLAPPSAEKTALGLWGAYMPLGVALALLLGPALIAWGGWPGWWWALSAGLGCRGAVGAARRAGGQAAARRAGSPFVFERWSSRLRDTARCQRPLDAGTRPSPSTPRNGWP